MKRIIIYIMLALFISTSCTTNTLEQSNVPTPVDEIMQIHLGVYPDGVMFWDWRGVLRYNYKTNGSLMSQTSTTTGSAKFGKEEDRDYTTHIEIEANLSGETYTVKGTYESENDFELRLLGTSIDGESDTVLFLEKGKGEILQTEDAIWPYDRPAKFPDAGK